MVFQEFSLDFKLIEYVDSGEFRSVGWVVYIRMSEGYYMPKFRNAFSVKVLI